MVVAIFAAHQRCGVVVPRQIHHHLVRVDHKVVGEFIALLKANGEKWAGFLDGLSDSLLAEQVAMPEGTTPASKSRFEMIISVKEHEMHHRAQLFLILRMLGQTPHLTRHMQERMAAAAQRS